MALSRQRKRELRLEALSIVWQVLDAKATDIALDRDGLLPEEVKYIASVIDSKAQTAFCEYSNHKKREATQ